MEYIGFIILIIILIGLSFFYPAAKVLLITNIFAMLRKKEAEIVLVSYTHLPKFIKERVSSKDFADIIASVLNFGLTAVEKDLTKK